MKATSVSSLDSVVWLAMRVGRRARLENSWVTWGLLGRECRDCRLEIQETGVVETRLGCRQD